MEEINLIDTHSHIYLDDFQEDIDSVIAKAKAVGVRGIYLPNIDRSSVADLLALVDRNPGFCFPMMGLHPCSVKADYIQELAVLMDLAAGLPIAAIGEIGLDYHWDLTYKEQQMAAFRQQIEWSLELDLPIVIHSRKSFDDVLQTLEQYQPRGVRGICHCFGGTVQEARRALDLGFFLGIGGVLTFKKAGLDATLAELGSLDGLVLETDSPYLAPTPHRGKRNESAYVRLVAERLAEVLNMPLAEVARKTTENALMAFGHSTSRKGKA